MSRESSMPLIDHEGRVFPTISAMCKFWKIGLNTYRIRVKWLGWDKEKALTTPPDKRYARNRKKEVVCNR